MNKYPLSLPGLKSRLGTLWENLAAHKKVEFESIRGLRHDTQAIADLLNKQPEYWKLFEGFEMHPCVRLYTDDPADFESYEQCEWKDPDIAVISIYGLIAHEHALKHGRLRCLMDFSPSDRVTAEFIMSLLQATL